LLTIGLRPSYPQDQEGFQGPELGQVLRIIDVKMKQEKKEALRSLKKQKELFEVDLLSLRAGRKRGPLW